jgi:hypothetical protein
MSRKNSNDVIGNRSRDLSTCSAVPQPTAPPRATDDNDNDNSNNIIKSAYKCNWQLVVLFEQRSKVPFLYCFVLRHFQFVLRICMLRSKRKVSELREFHPVECDWGPFVNSNRLDGAELCHRVLDLNIFESTPAIRL